VRRLLVVILRVVIAVVVVLGLIGVAMAIGRSRSSPSRAVAAANVSCVTQRLPPAAAAGQIVQWGHIKSLTRRGARYELRFDPAWWLTGVTAQRAAVADGAIRPGEAVANDYYVVDERHRLLTYLVPPTARATVLTGATCSTSVSISELAQIVKGGNPRHRRLYDRGNHLGYWLRTRIDTARSLDQQYQP
jgi:hypothetical protein